MLKRFSLRKPLFAILIAVSVVGTVGMPSPPAFAKSVNRTLEEHLQDKINSLSAAFNRPAERDAFKAFYARRDYRPVWVDEGGPTRAARSIIAGLDSAEDWGLETHDLKLVAVHAPLNQSRWTPAQAAAAEYEISTAIFIYARLARGSRIPDPARMLSTYLDRRPTALEPALILPSITTVSDPDRVLRSIHPRHEQFHKLQALYAKLREQKKSAEVAGLVPEIISPWYV